MLTDYSEFEKDLLKLPINGKVYIIPELGAADGARIQLEQDPKTKRGMSTAELRAMVLGSALDEMLADNVPLAAVGRALSAALADAQSSRAVAELIWETGADPKAIAETVKNSAKSTSTGAEATTKTPDSTSGTKSPAP